MNGKSSPFTIWETGDWRRALVWLATDYCGPRIPRDQIEEHIQALLRRDRPIGSKLDLAIGDVLGDTLEKAALFGFALARTWPPTFEGLEDWADRAWEYAGLNKPADPAPEGDQ